MRVSIDASGIYPVMTAIANAADTWPEHKRSRFTVEWKALLSNGCEWVECRGLAVLPSADLLAHCRAYGVAA